MGQPKRADGPELPGPAATFLRLFGTTRFLLVLAILGVFVASLAMLAFCLIVLAKVIWNTFESGDYTIEATQHLAVELIEITDFFLLGMVLYVVGIGMFQLFVSPDIHVPAWMRVNNLDDLKSQLINVTVVLLAISFLAIVIEWNGDNSILYLGGALAAIILSLCAFLLVHQQHGEDEGHRTEDKGGA